MLKKFKPYMMPFAMTLGAMFYQFFASLSALIPYLIFAMLFLTYCKLKLSDIRLSRMHFWLILIQVVGSLTAYLIISPFNTTLAQGVMICILAPTATSAPVITGMLMGNVESLTAYSLLSNLSVAVVAPVFFSLVGTNQSHPFIESFAGIIQPMSLLMLLPLVSALLLRRVSPSFVRKVSLYSGVSFYLWSIALMIVTGITVGFVIQQSDSSYTTEILIALGALVVCLSQFLVGRRIGKEYNDMVAGGQGLGQKNTILAIWMAQTYLNPIASIGPGAYVLWQNLVNSYQVWKKRKSL
jgi:bile acid:Na+ symporter, BASS family